MYSTPDDAETAFYEALEEGNLIGAMAVWAEDEEVVCVHPGGPRQVGHAAVRAGWDEILSNGPLRLRWKVISRLTSLMSAVHSIQEFVEVQTPNGTQWYEVNCTNVYLKGPTGWRLVVHHASPAPQEAAASFQPTGSVLH